MKKIKGAKRAAFLAKMGIKRHPKRKLLGWIPDLPDHRDYTYSRPRPSQLPPSTDLRGTCPTVENQGQLGSCTANALAGSLEYLEKKHNKRFFDISRLFIYYNTRLIQGTVGFDSGASIRNTVKSLANFGACAEPKWPYIISKFKMRPGQPCYKEGLTHKIKTYERIYTLDQMKECLAAGYPFVFGFSVYSNFMSQAVATTGIVNLPQVGESLLGGHAVMAVGYDDATSRFIVRNSWGATWGMQGYFTMPYEYLTNRNLSDDIWTISVAAGL